MKNFLVCCDPSGTHTKWLLNQGIDPNSITVWENEQRHCAAVRYVDNNVNLLYDDNTLSSLPKDSMNFDNIIGNPPFADNKKKAKKNKLWYKCVEYAINNVKDGGTISLITPYSIISETGFGKKMLKLFSTKFNLVKIDYNATRYFPNESVSICQWTVIAEPYSGETEVIDAKGTYTYDIRTGVPCREEDMVPRDIIKKIALSAHSRIPLKMGQSIADKDYDDNGIYNVYRSGNNIERTNVVPNTGDNLKFVVPYSCSPKGRFITTGYIGMLNSWCSILSEEEGEHLMNIIDHPLIKFFYSTYKKTSGFTPAVKNSMVPMLESFDDLRGQFYFTDVEWDYLVENNYV